MKLPHWVPEVRRPFNPAFRDTWEAMSRTERQASWLVDWGLVLSVILALGLLSGCTKPASDSAQDRYRIVRDSGGTPKERCDAGREVVRALLEEGKVEDYQRWRLIVAIDCLATELGPIG